MWTAGIITVVFFYVIILVVGICAGKRKRTASSGQKESEDLMLAGRNMNMFVGVLTMTATWVGGGYINDTAESIYHSGIVWCQVPFAYALSLVIGGLFFANKMRAEGYVTMLDPFQDHFGKYMGIFLFFPALWGEVCRSAAILAVLGAAMNTSIGLNTNTSIILSACISLFYTLLGGLYSVACIDVIRLFCIFIGLWLCIPFTLLHPAVGSLAITDLVGSVDSTTVGLYLDYWLASMLGGIPWQMYFQRVLSSQSAFRAQLLSYAGAFGCIVMAIPPIIIGAIAKATTWSETDFPGYFHGQSLVLPMVLRYLPPWSMSFIGLAAVSAGMMPSDSSILSAASMFARNIYKRIIRQNASEREIIWVMRGAIVFVGCKATVLALKPNSIFGLWFLSFDLVYVILFPQLVCVVYFKQFCNTYGSLTAYIVGFLLRFLGGEEIIGLPAFIKYPFYDEKNAEQLFPFRTLSMLISLTTLLVVSSVSKWLFESGRIPPQMDVFRCFVSIPKDILKVPDPATSQKGVMNRAECPPLKEPLVKMHRGFEQTLILSSDEAGRHLHHPPSFFASRSNATLSQNTITTNI